MKARNHSESTKRPEASAILECPSCYSQRAVILNAHPPKARCADCSTSYEITYELSHPRDEQKEEPEQQPTSNKRKTKADYRAEITPAPPLSAEELGPKTVFIQETLQATPQEIAQAEHKARKMAQNSARSLRRAGFWTRNIYAI